MNGFPDNSAQRAYDENPIFQAQINAALAARTEQHPRRQPRTQPDMPRIGTPVDTQYEDLLSRTLHTGTQGPDRTGIGTRSVFGAQLRYPLWRGFPLITTKKIHLKSIAVELLWMLNGDTNIKYLTDNGVSIWDEWADENGDLGPIYGAQWRNWQGPHGNIDQIAHLVDTIKNDPFSRRQLVMAYNPGVLHQITKAPPPCHFAFQTFPEHRPDGHFLNLHIYQRSADVFLGLPFNIASYALLLTLLSIETGYAPGDLVWSGSVIHLYNNHVEQAVEQLRRDVRPFPGLSIEKDKDLLAGLEGPRAYTHQDFQAVLYDPHPHIPADVAI